MTVVAELPRSVMDLLAWAIDMGYIGPDMDDKCEFIEELLHLAKNEMERPDLIPELMENYINTTNGTDIGFVGDDEFDNLITSSALGILLVITNCKVMNEHIHDEFMVEEIMGVSIVLSF